jgi:hypothetical protein
MYDDRLLARLQSLSFGQSLSGRRDARSQGHDFLSAPPNCRKIGALAKFLRLLYPDISPKIKFRECADAALADAIFLHEQRSLPKGYKARCNVVSRRSLVPSEQLGGICAN